MITSKHRKPHILVVVLAFALSTLFIVTLLQVVLFSDSSTDYQHIHLKHQGNYKQTSSSSSPSSLDHDNNFQTEDDSLVSCEKYEFYQAKLLAGESEIHNLKKPPHCKIQL
ncbi:unnamed protein product [Ambrosiozyma monospora]|uniref:Unnamed protein product n=1 Tax=Ambrosiozyma monospora TaxID=43982 RepID=A0ACB5T134_AMBMO|nr:unnamed protein product [Ambrosiozyma monospora]